MEVRCNMENLWQTIKEFLSDDLLGRVTRTKGSERDRVVSSFWAAWYFRSTSMKGWGYNRIFGCRWARSRQDSAELSCHYIRARFLPVDVWLSLDQDVSCRIGPRGERESGETGKANGTLGTERRYEPTPEFTVPRVIFTNDPFSGFDTAGFCISSFESLYLLFVTFWEEALLFVVNFSCLMVLVRFGGRLVTFDV